MTKAGLLKLNYICGRCPQENTILILTEVSLNDFDLKALQFRTPKHFRGIHKNLSGKGSGIIILATKEITKIHQPLVSDCVTKGRTSHTRVKLSSNEELVIYSVYLSHDDRSAIRQLNDLQNHIFLIPLEKSAYIHVQYP